MKVVYVLVSFAINSDLTMISRSSSAYQPLAQAAASEVVTPAVPRRNYSGNATSVKIQGIVADNDDGDEDDPMSHEVKKNVTNVVSPTKL